MTVATADRTAADVGFSRRETTLLTARIGLLALVAILGVGYALPRIAATKHAVAVVIAAPLVAGVLALRAWRGHAHEPKAIPVRSADLTIAAGFLGVAAFLAWQLPGVFAADAIDWGASLAVVAPATAATIAVLFGTRMLYRLRGPVALLALMSPALVRPAYAAVGAATGWLTRRAVELAIALHPAFVSRTGESAGAGRAIASLVADRLDTAGSADAALFVVLVVLGVFTGRRSRKLAWAGATVALCWLAALVPVAVAYARSGPAGVLALPTGATTGSLVAVAASCAIALMLAPRCGLRPVPRVPQPQPLRCLPRGESGLLALAATGFAALVISAPLHLPDTASPVATAAASGVDAAAATLTQDDVIAGLPGATPASVDPRELALAGSGAQWNRWTVSTAGTGLPTSASVTVDTVRPENDLDAAGLATAFEAGGYRLTASQNDLLGNVAATRQTFRGAAGDALATVIWAPVDDPAELVVVTVHETGPPSSADSVAAYGLATRIASSGRPVSAARPPTGLPAS